MPGNVLYVPGGMPVRAWNSGEHASAFLVIGIHPDYTHTWAGLLHRVLARFMDATPGAAGRLPQLRFELNQVVKCSEFDDRHQHTGFYECRGHSHDKDEPLRWNHIFHAFIDHHIWERSKHAKHRSPQVDMDIDELRANSRHFLPKLTLTEAAHPHVPATAESTDTDAAAVAAATSTPTDGSAAVNGIPTLITPRYIINNAAPYVDYIYNMLANLHRAAQEYIDAVVRRRAIGDADVPLAIDNTMAKLYGTKVNRKQFTGTLDFYMWMARDLGGELETRYPLPLENVMHVWQPAMACVNQMRYQPVHIDSIYQLAQDIISPLLNQQWFYELKALAIPHPAYAAANGNGKTSKDDISLPPLTSIIPLATSQIYALPSCEEIMTLRPIISATGSTMAVEKAYPIIYTICEQLTEIAQRNEKRLHYYHDQQDLFVTRAQQQLNRKQGAIDRHRSRMTRLAHARAKDDHEGTIGGDDDDHSEL
jgi:hypothetical protein